MILGYIYILPSNFKHGQDSRRPYVLKKYRKIDNTLDGIAISVFKVYHDVLNLTTVESFLFNSLKHRIVIGSDIYNTFYFEHHESPQIIICEILKSKGVHVREINPLCMTKTPYAQQIIALREFLNKTDFSIDDDFIWPHNFGGGLPYQELLNISLPHPRLRGALIIDLVHYFNVCLITNNKNLIKLCESYLPMNEKNKFIAINYDDYFDFDFNLDGRFVVFDEPFIYDKPVDEKLSLRIFGYPVQPLENNFKIGECVKRGYMNMPRQVSHDCTIICNKILILMDDIFIVCTDEMFDNFEESPTGTLSLSIDHPRYLDCGNVDCLILYLTKRESLSIAILYLNLVMRRGNKIFYYVCLDYCSMFLIAKFNEILGTEFAPIEDLTADFNY